MKDYKKYINALRKCAKEHEGDRTFTGHVVVSTLCQDTANLLEELEQEPILDKLRAEIEAFECWSSEDSSDGYDKYIEQYEVLKIIDKYRQKIEG